MFDMLNGVRMLALQDDSAVSETPKAAADAAAEVGAKVAEVAADAAFLGGGTVAILVLAALVGAFVVGAILAKNMRMPEWGARFGVCLAALAIGIMPFIIRSVNGESLGDGMRLGIDLAGGTNMVFQVKEEEGKELTSEIMDRMIGAIGKRINPTGTAEITVRQVGRDRIEVIVPGEDPQTVSDIKRRITRLGSLDFFVTVDESIDDSTMIRDARALSNSNKQLFREMADGTREVYAMWVPAYEKGEDLEPQLLRNNSGTPLVNVVTREVDRLKIVDGEAVRYPTEEYLVLVGAPSTQVTGKYLTGANAAIDNESGGQMVRFFFNQRGAFLFGQLTGKYKPKTGRENRKLAIVLDRQLYSAPSINGVINEQGSITGDFNAAEVKELTDVLNAGALEVPINRIPLSEATIDPTLGEDVRQKGVTAIMIAATVVVVFMLVYYRFAGIIAIICLLLNLLLVLTIMMGIKATFTLPGLAGLVLTIGMAVDANVLIFERMREEVKKGSSTRIAIQNGFGKAFTTIIDANVTTLITAVILYMIGTDTVKGFAVSLFIGIVVSMFTALYVGRALFDVSEKKGWLKQLNMFSIVGNTNINFLGKRIPCAILSLALIATGMFAFASRGEKNYDIDFTGGTMVTFQLTEPSDTASVEGVLAGVFKDDFTIERLTLAGDDAASAGKHFRLRTTLGEDTSEGSDDASSDKTAPKITPEQLVGGMVETAFGSSDLKLRKVAMEHGELSEITIADDDESANAMQYARFNGGQQVEMTLSSEVALGTLRDEFTTALMTVSDESGQTKYPETEAFFGIEGASDSEGVGDGQQVLKYDTVNVRTTSDVTPEDLTSALATMQQKLDASPLFDEVNTFQSAVAGEMKTSAILAIIISLIAIVAYVWFRFQRITFGLAAVVALVHDVLIVMGVMALASMLSGTAIGDALLLNDFRINLPMVAAFLTIVGYSLNDTIVVFDRIREVRGKNPDLTDSIVNTSLNQTLSRTLLTSLTTFLVVAILYAIGGEGIHGFAFCLTMGVIVGTYSSIYVASPVLIWLMNRQKN